LFFNATSKELLFRGWLYKNLATPTRQGMVLAALATSILFALLHTLDGRHWAWLILTGANGLAWCGLRIRTGSVYPGIVAHILNNWLANDLLTTAAPLSSGNTIMYISVRTLFNVLFFVWCVRTLPTSEAGQESSAARTDQIGVPST
jgi:membrane protease YdiL (CAAX protease family)